MPKPESDRTAKDARLEAGAVARVAIAGIPFLLEQTIVGLALMEHHFARLMQQGILKPHDRARLRDARTQFYEATKRTAE